jgi:hypothetical protein
MVHLPPTGTDARRRSISVPYRQMRADPELA